MEALRGADSDQRRFELERRARLTYSEGARRAFRGGILVFGSSCRDCKLTYNRGPPASDISIDRNRHSHIDFSAKIAKHAIMSLSSASPSTRDTACRVRIVSFQRIHSLPTYPQSYRSFIARKRTHWSLLAITLEPKISTRISAFLADERKA